MPVSSRPMCVCGGKRKCEGTIFGGSILVCVSIGALVLIFFLTFIQKEETITGEILSRVL